MVKLVASPVLACRVYLWGSLEGLRNRMAKAWGYAIAHDLLEVRKTTLSGSLPNCLPFDARLEYKTGAKSQCHLSLSIRLPRKSAG